MIKKINPSGGINDSDMRLIAQENCLKDLFSCSYGAELDYVKNQLNKSHGTNFQCSGAHQYLYEKEKQTLNRMLANSDWRHADPLMSIEQAYLKALYKKIEHDICEGVQNSENPQEFLEASGLSAAMVRQLMPDGKLNHTMFELKLPSIVFDLMEPNITKRKASIPLPPSTIIESDDYHMCYNMRHGG